MAVCMAGSASAQLASGDIYQPFLTNPSFFPFRT
jgi:hypothetical protein